MYGVNTRGIVPATIGAALLSGAALLGGCGWQEPGTPVQGAVLGANNPRTVDYPGGRYQLYGDGTTSSPYYWVWIPAGTSPPPPPALPGNQVAMSTGGRYQLYGNGTTSSPYYYVWIPAGTTVVPPPPPPPRP